MKKSILFLSAVVVSLSISLAHAQLQNMVLFEEATNASCPPCASQNPYFEQFLQDNSDAAIGVSYHAWWPGNKDPMFLNDSAMNRSRITYYGFDQIGVPTCVVNGKYATASSGWYQGAPGDLDALASALEDARNVDPTCDISVNRYTIPGDSERVDVTVHALTAITGSYLRIIVVEKEHQYSNAGSNGEKAFPNIARKMLPNAAGTKVTLAQGESKTFSLSFKYNSAWTTDQLSIIAFVQTNSGKAVNAAVQQTAPPQSLGVEPGATASGLSIRSVGEPMTSYQKIEYTLGSEASVKVTFTMVDMLGRSVMPERTEIVTPGTHSFQLPVSGLASGSYRVVARTDASLTEVPVLIGN
jgi:hypothetical protein